MPPRQRATPSTPSDRRLRPLTAGHLASAGCRLTRRRPGQTSALTRERLGISDFGFRTPLCHRSGYAVLFVLAFTGISLIALTGALQWAATNAHLTDRNNQYFATAAAAEAATEKVLSRVLHDYQSQGESLVYANLPVYQTLVPTPEEEPAWADFQFPSPAGPDDGVYVARLSPEAFIELNSQYTGLRGVAASYRIVGNARKLNRPDDVIVGIKQDIQVASIPVFQFAIFYSLDLEIHNGPAMTINGRVHSNQNIYADPGTSTTYQSDVTAAGNIFVNQRSPNDPRPGTQGGSVNFLGAHDSGVRSLTLPIGTNNSPTAVHAVIEVPPAGESPNSAMGRQRYYNKADLIVLVTDTGVTATSGAFNSFATSVPWNQVSNFVNTGVSFYNKREQRTVQATEIDVAKLAAWSATNTILRPALGHRDVRAMFVADLRSQTSSTQSGVRLVNGQTLPPLGLTVATPNPLYVKGHFNAPPAHLGTTNTSLTKPASLVADAITILSGNWNDANSTKSLSDRTATDTTVNAAIIAGIVESNSTSYSGGVENFPRFLENWSGRKLTYNGSMVVMFPSQIATGPWLGTGSSIGIYNPPQRNWAFDVNFLDPTKLPPGTPEMRVVIRGQWAMLPPGRIE